jgi:uncharacterized protein YecE (DUF72 family)
MNSRALQTRGVDARLWFGAQGWLYKDWVGSFNPPGTGGRTMLSEYARLFSTVEVDSTYYATPAAQTVEGWRRRSPDGFRFSLKVPSEVTHVRAFRDADAAFAEFLERVRILGPKLGAILVQCPPDFDPDPENREALCRFMRTQLPRDVPTALELRDSRWFDEDLFALARENEFTLAITEGVHSDLALAGAVADELERDPPADFAYLRWLGDRSLTRFDRPVRDCTKSLDVWERLIRSLRRGVRDVYGYANNHYQGHSPATVRAMLARLGEEVPPETTMPRLL